MRTSTRRLALYVFVVPLMAGCSSGPSQSESADSAAETDSSALDAFVGPDTTEEDDRLQASDYCEESMEMFCDFYLRCGRMAVDDLASCRMTFAEACNARYEPYYSDLAASDLLHLSASGLKRCAKRLETVACEAQVFDLDGCDDVWVGHVPVGGACGPGLEGFVCVEGAACHLDLSFCGTCRLRTDDGGTCDATTRCHENSTCKDGVCVRRPHGGEPCTDDGKLRCVVGTSCSGGRCLATIVGPPGAPCADDRNCRFRSSCFEGVCVQTALLGEACGAGVGCASGYCNGGECTPLARLDEDCNSNSACETGNCTGRVCRPIRWGCVGE